MDDQDVRRTNLVECSERGDRLAATVHIGHRLDEQNASAPAAGEAHRPDGRAPLRFWNLSKARSWRSAEVDYLKADIVPVARKSGPGLPRPTTIFCGPPLAAERAPRGPLAQHGADGAQGRILCHSQTSTHLTAKNAPTTANAASV